MLKIGTSMRRERYGMTLNDSEADMLMDIQLYRDVYSWELLVGGWLVE